MRSFLNNFIVFFVKKTKHYYLCKQVQPLSLTYREWLRNNKQKII